MLKYTRFFIILFYSFTLNAQTVLPGAARFELYLPMLKGKSVAVFANQTSMVGEKHLVDFLIANGTADAGEKVGNYTDTKTGIPVVSLYGAKRKPSTEDLASIDLVVFDIQDVGVRFYTFISSLEELMESVIASKKQIIVLDRPNPNGHYVDGPVLEKAQKSFVGMQPIPVVYGMTIGEYAKMLVGEKWLTEPVQHIYDSLLKKGKNLLKVVPCKNYTHQTVYTLPVKPSPNLPDMSAIYWYPSTCFFEGTVLSEGRGTTKPFQLFGHPSLPSNLFAFTPTSMPGATNPKLVNQKCFGWNLAGEPSEVRKRIAGKLNLSFLLEAYRLFADKEHFFIMPKSGNIREAFFNKLAGNEELMLQIIAGNTEAEIRKSWEPALSDFKKIRLKYLLYK